MAIFSLTDKELHGEIVAALRQLGPEIEHHLQRLQVLVPQYNSRLAQARALQDKALDHLEALEEDGAATDKTRFVRWLWGERDFRNIQISDFDDALFEHDDPEPFQLDDAARLEPLPMDV